MSTEKNPRNLLDELETLQKVLDDAAGEQIDFDRVLTQLNTVDEIPVLSDLFSRDEPPALKPVKNVGRNHLSAVKTPQPDPASRPVISRDVLEFIRNEMQRKGNEDNAIETLSALLGKAHLQDASKMSANDFAGSQRPEKPEPLVFDDSHVFEPMQLDDLLDGIGNSQRGKDHHLPDDLAEAMFAAIDGDDDSSDQTDDDLITLLDEALPEDEIPLIDTTIDSTSDDAIDADEAPDIANENETAAEPATENNHTASQQPGQQPATVKEPAPQQTNARADAVQTAARPDSFYAAIDSKAYQPATPAQATSHAVDLGSGMIPTPPVSRPSNNPFLPQSVLDRLTSERLAAQHSAEEAHRTMQRVMEQKQQKDAAALAQLDTLEKEKLVEDLINELTPTIQARLRERLRSMVGLKHPAPKR
ncbi:hypothetical protein [Oceanobacter mangrovi]|uniref:hypothetical protein n=1 Tax=Oceanobacter mangrovi TaxID=2862510 RepID=UPI001C8E6360|nr:hypothetical protein [Oceanobacter mangrovi]